MILLPIGQEDSTVRRLPWVTFGIMIACVVVFFATGFGHPPSRGAQAMKEAVTYFMEHPYLQLDPQLEKLIFRGLDEEQRKAVIEMATEYTKKPSSQWERDQQQSELDELTKTAFAALDDNLFFRYGVVADKISPIALLTYMFLHGGWMHLLGNLFILYLVGPFLEDVWGRPLFAGFYIGTGVIAALGWAMMYPSLHTPMIGASGAIAGVMGGFLVRHFSSRIRFFYMFGLIWRGTFMAPAWLMLPLWFGEQIFMALMVDGLGSDGGSGVAYWAHVGGFGVGVAGALVIKKLRIEERYIHPAIQQKVTLVDNTVIERAQEARLRGEVDEAYTLLAEAWKSDPSNRDVALSLWDIALAQGWAAHAAPAMIRCIQEELRCGEGESALEHWYELIGQAPQTLPDPPLCLRMAQTLYQGGHRDWAGDALRRALGGSSPLPGPMATKIARLAAEIDPALAQTAIERALAAPDLFPQDRETLEQLRQAAPVGVPQP